MWLECSGSRLSYQTSFGTHGLLTSGFSGFHESENVDCQSLIPDMISGLRTSLFSCGISGVLQEPEASSAGRWYRSVQSPDWFHRTWEGWQSRQNVKYARRDHSDPTPAPPTYGQHRTSGQDSSEHNFARPIHYTWHTQTLTVDRPHLLL